MTLECSDLEKKFLKHLEEFVDKNVPPKKHNGIRDKEIMMKCGFSNQKIKIAEIVAEYKLSPQRIQQINFRQGLISGQWLENFPIDLPLELEEALLEIVKKENFSFPIGKEELGKILYKYFENMEDRVIVQVLLLRIFQELGITENAQMYSYEYWLENTSFENKMKRSRDGISWWLKKDQIYERAKNMRNALQ